VAGLLPAKHRGPWREWHEGHNAAAGPRGQHSGGSPPYSETLALERRLGGQRGDWVGAEPLHREALETARAIYGPEHPNVTAGMVSLGSVLEAKGDMAGAEALYRDSLAMRRKLLGPEHPDTTRSMYALTYLLRTKGDPEGAVRLCREVLALRGRLLPDAHPMVAATLEVEGLSLVDLSRAREAEPLLHESMKLRRQSLPPRHRLLAASESSLGACLLALGRFPDAEGFLLRVRGPQGVARGRVRVDGQCPTAPRGALRSLGQARESQGVESEAGGPDATVTSPTVQTASYFRTGPGEGGIVLLQHLALLKESVAHAGAVEIRWKGDSGRERHGGAPQNRRPPGCSISSIPRSYERSEYLHLKITLLNQRLGLQWSTSRVAEARTSEAIIDPRNVWPTRGLAAVPPPCGAARSQACRAVCAIPL